MASYMLTIANDFTTGWFWISARTAVTHLSIRLFFKLYSIRCVYLFPVVLTELSCFVVFKMLFVSSALTNIKTQPRYATLPCYAFTYFSDGCKKQWLSEEGVVNVLFSASHCFSSRICRRSRISCSTSSGCNATLFPLPPLRSIQVCSVSGACSSPHCRLCPLGWVPRRF